MFKWSPVTSIPSSKKRSPHFNILILRYLSSGRLLYVCFCNTFGLAVFIYTWLLKVPVQFTHYHAITSYNYKALINLFITQLVTIQCFPFTVISGIKNVSLFQSSHFSVLLFSVRGFYVLHFTKGSMHFVWTSFSHTGCMGDGMHKPKASQERLPCSWSLFT